jgi:galactokinase
VITENARVLEARDALLHHELARFGKLLNQSHVSLKDDYEVSIPEMDLLVELASADPRVYGARLTGGGFGGAIVIAAHEGVGPDVAERVVSAYAEQSHRRATVLIAA